MGLLLSPPPWNINNILHNSKNTSESYSFNYEYVLFLSCLLPHVCHQVFTLSFYPVVSMHAGCLGEAKIRLMWIHISDMSHFTGNKSDLGIETCSVKPACDLTVIWVGFLR